MEFSLFLRPVDFVVIVLAVAATGGAAWNVYAVSGSAAQVLIRCDQRQWLYPLSCEDTVAISGPLGATIVKIDQNEVWIESSPCPNQLCREAGHIKKRGDWIACLPNHVFIVIQGKDVASNVDVSAW
jgi:hypothetical protein